MRSERCRTCAIASSSSTISTRGGRSKSVAATVAQMVGPPGMDPARTPPGCPPPGKGARRQDARRRRRSGQRPTHGDLIQAEITPPGGRAPPARPHGAGAPGSPAPVVGAANHAAGPRARAPSRRCGGARARGRWGVPRRRGLPALGRGPAGAGPARRGTAGRGQARLRARAGAGGGRRAAAGARAPAADAWRPHWLMARGGALGEAELWCAEHLLSRAGADILAVFLALAGVMLTTGATLAGIVRATGAGVEATSRVVRRSQGTLAGTLGRAGRGERPDPAQRLSPADRFAQAQAVAVLDAPDGPQGPGGEGPVDAGGEGDGVPGGDGAGALGGQTGDGALDGRTGGGTLDLDAASDASAAGGEGEGEGPDTVRMVVRSTHVEAPANGELGAVAPAQAARAQLTPRGRYRASVTDDPDFQWRLPDARLLTRSGAEASRPDTAGQEQVAATLLETLGHFGIQARVIGRVTGPHITRYELRLAPGIKVAKVAQLKDDLAYALAATDIRILAPIPGKQAVGVEVPNARRRIVHLGDVFQAPPPDWSPLTVWLGKDIAGRAIGADLTKMPHLLVAGTTGAGKSACVNAMLSSILLRATPHEVRIVLVDPKQVELNHYESVPHLLTPVITSPRMAANALQNLVREMEQRYSIMSLARTRALPELTRAREGRGEPPLPYILCVIDELADLMMVAPADVEDSIIRLAQKARAVGMHLVLATQSPRVDVITGMIKANVPSRIAFAVSSQTDSRVILDQNGAESLLGQGDMLFSPVGTNKLQRIQGAYIDEEQIAELTESWRRQGEPELREELLEEVEDEADAGSRSEER